MRKMGMTKIGMISVLGLLLAGVLFVHGCGKSDEAGQSVQITIKTSKV